MARKIAVLSPDPSTPVLEETTAPEEELQEALKLRPELLPVEELAVEGPLMIVGRETPVASGAVDLLGVGRGGEVVVIEFKTGPNNSDFRSAAAQLLDYGAQLWGMSYETFETSVALRYFAGNRCPQGSPVRAAVSLVAAARATWADIGDEGLDVFRQGLSRQLESGGFRYVLAAQAFTPTMERTLRYLNSQMAAAKFYGVELIRFGGDEMAVLEARTIVRPEGTTPSQPRPTLDEQRFLERVSDLGYRDTLEHFFASCRGLGLTLAWGSSGVSVRFALPETGKLVSVAWVFPPGVIGWMGLTDLTAGFDPSKSVEPTVQAAFDAYLSTVGQLPGAMPVERVGLRAVHVDPRTAGAAFPSVIDAILVLVRALGAA